MTHYFKRFMKQLIVLFLPLFLLFACGRNIGNMALSTPEKTVTEAKSQPEETKENSMPVCDMQLVWDQIEKMPLDEEAETNSSFTIEPNYISYELGVYHHRDRKIVSFFDGTLFKVLDVYNYEHIYDDEIQNESHHIKEYLFKDGKLSESELQDELNGFKEAYFDEDDLVAIDEEGNRTVFFWNGKKMEKKE